MDIKILDSWLRDYLKAKATAKQIAEYLSLTSVSIERIDPYDKDFIYHIEVTTNRPDLMSIIGLAREAATVLPQFGIDAKFEQKKLLQYSSNPDKTEARSTNNLISIENDPRLVNRICAAVLEVTVKPSPDYIKERLETAGIRSLNNLIDVTNYIMREMGHPAHVFDLDRLGSNILIRESKKGEMLETLDHKKYELPGGDIIADNGKGEIVDLLGIMGTANSVVTDTTKRILLFLDNNEPLHMRKTSMNLGIRTEAVVLNEKGIDRELAFRTLLRGIELYKEIANGKVIGEIIDIYPNKEPSRKVILPKKKLTEVVGVEIADTTAIKILEQLGFEVKNNKETLETTVPSSRLNDVSIPEDIIEEVARVYGYHKLPIVIPPIENVTAHQMTNEFYFEKRIKDALKYWGFTECYTYSMVSENLYEGPIENAIKLSNPLSEDHVYMRKTLVPSLLEVVNNNKSLDELKIFELSYTYHKNKEKLPDQQLMLAGVIKEQQADFLEVKGLIEQLLTDLGIHNSEFQKRSEGGDGADVYIGKDYLGDIEILDDHTINFELSFAVLLKHATLAKTYTPLMKFPPVIEDIRIQIDENIAYTQIVSVIKKQDTLIKDVALLDIYENKKTFRITYQNPEKNLTSEDIAPIRNKIIHALETKLNAKAA